MDSRPPVIGSKTFPCSLLSLPFLGGSRVRNSLPGVVDTQPLDLQDAKQDISTRLSLNLPENVTLVGPQTVQVQVSITPIQTSITLSNLADQPDWTSRKA